MDSAIQISDFIHGEEIPHAMASLRLTPSMLGEHLTLFGLDSLLAWIWEAPDVESESTKHVC